MRENSTVKLSVYYFPETIVKLSHIFYIESVHDEHFYRWINYDLLCTGIYIYMSDLENKHLMFAIPNVAWQHALSVLAYSPIFIANTVHFEIPSEPL